MLCSVTAKRGPTGFARILESNEWMGCWNVDVQQVAPFSQVEFAVMFALLQLPRR